MPDWLFALLLFQGVGTGFILLFGAVMLSAADPYSDNRERKTLARVMLASPVWIPVALTYGIYRLIQIARTGE